jgi:hypothetical protein
MNHSSITTLKLKHTLASVEALLIEFQALSKPPDDALRDRVSRTLVDVKAASNADFLRNLTGLGDGDTVYSYEQLPMDSLAVIKTLKERAAAAFKACDYREALHLCDQTVVLEPYEAIHLANRSLAHLRLATPLDLTAAVSDAQAAVDLKPDWGKAHFRLGCALLAKAQSLKEEEEGPQQQAYTSSSKQPMMMPSGKAVVAKAVASLARAVELNPSEKKFAGSLEEARRLISSTSCPIGDILGGTTTETTCDATGGAKELLLEVASKAPPKSPQHRAVAPSLTKAPSVPPRATFIKDGALRPDDQTQDAGHGSTTVGGEQDNRMPGSDSTGVLAATETSSAAVKSDNVPGLLSASAGGLQKNKSSKKHASKWREVRVPWCSELVKGSCLSLVVDNDNDGDGDDGVDGSAAGTPSSHSRNQNRRFVLTRGAKNTDMASKAVGRAQPSTSTKFKQGGAVNSSSSQGCKTGQLLWKEASPLASVVASRYRSQLCHCCFTSNPAPSLGCRVQVNERTFRFETVRTKARTSLSHC